MRLKRIPTKIQFMEKKQLKAAIYTCWHCHNVGLCVAVFNIYFNIFLQKYISEVYLNYSCGFWWNKLHIQQLIVTSMTISIFSKLLRFTSPCSCPWPWKISMPRTKPKPRPMQGLGLYYQGKSQRLWRCD